MLWYCPLVPRPAGLLGLAFVRWRADTCNDVMTQPLRPEVLPVSDTGTRASLAG